MAADTTLQKSAGVGKLGDLAPTPMSFQKLTVSALEKVHEGGQDHLPLPHNRPPHGIFFKGQILL